MVAADQHLAGVAGRQRAVRGVDDPYLGAGKGAARGRGDHLGRIAATAHRDDARALRKAVGGQDGGDLQLAAQPLDQFQGDHGGAGDHQAQRGEVVPGAGGVVQELLMEGGRAGEDGDPLGGDLGERGLHAEDRLGDHRRAAQQTGDDAGLVAEGVEERVDDQVAVVLPEAASSLQTS